MKKRLLVIFMLLLALCGCDGAEEELTLSGQTLEQLGITNEAHEKTSVINYEPQKALWFTMMDFKKALEGKTREEFTADIGKILGEISDTGFNTVYVHVRPYNDAYYSSELFPLCDFFPKDYDPFAVLLEKAHGLRLSVHAWINPLRCQTEEEMKALDEKYPVKKWLDTERLKAVNGRLYLDPAYDDVIEYIGDGVSELLEGYRVDGIHIDDYFYPTKDESFDRGAFEQSGREDLTQWRTENISKMVKEIYSRVKSRDTDILFGISPQGNIDADIDDLYADVESWCTQEGFCDYMTPQLYYGFKNESLPFEETLDRWIDMSKIPLEAGVCTYKIGKEDKWAGTGSDEWITDENIPSRECRLALERGTGAAVYSYGSLFGDESGELSEIRAALKGEP